jgi:glycosyltransferase involved in cell wall biosynthesis
VSHSENGATTAPRDRDHDRTPGWPRILLLEGALRDNGGLRVNHDLVRRWVADGVSASLLVLENVAPDTPMLTPSADVPWTYASAKVRRSRAALPFVIAGLVRHCRRADVVISGSEVGWQLLLGRLVTRLLRRPFVTLVQSLLGPAIDDWRPASLRRGLRWANRHVDAALCVAPGLVPQVVANGLAPDRVAVLPVGIDVDEVIRRGRQASAGARLRPDSATPLLVAMGRLSPVKGFDLLIDASARLRDQGLAHHIMIVGEGPQRAELEALIQARGLREEVELVGFLSEPQPLLAAADVFVLPSRREGNGGLVLLEALAHGRPIVAADCETGPREVLQDGAFGDLVPMQDPEALAAALARHLRDPSRLRAIAALGPARARDFDQVAAARRMLDHLRGFARVSTRA